MKKSKFDAFNVIPVSELRTILEEIGESIAPESRHSDYMPRGLGAYLTAKSSLPVVGSYEDREEYIRQLTAIVRVAMTKT